MIGRLHTREDSGIRLDAELRWWHDDAPVEHPRIIQVFNEGLQVTDDGKFKLVVGNDWCFVTVADAAFWAVAVDETTDGRLSLRLSDRTAEALDETGLAVGADGVMTARVKGGKAKARFNRDAQYQLGERLEETPSGLTLRVGAAQRPVRIANWGG